MSETPTRPGQVVSDKYGNIGIVTEPARKAGVWKGKVSVMWMGAPYTVIEQPEDLALVDPEVVRSFRRERRE